MGEWKRDGLLTRIVERVARALYRRSDLIVAVTPTALAQIAGRNVDASHLLLAPNAPERRAPVQQRDYGNGERRRNDRFTAIYAGNLGLASDIDVLLDAAGLLGQDGIDLEIVGDGAERARLEQRIQDERMDNVHFRGSFPRDEAMAMIADADVSIVPLRRGIEESVPTKLYDALSMGCPVIVVAGGEAQRAGTSLGAMCSPPGDAAALAALLRQLSLLDKNALRELGDRGKARVEAGFDRAGIMANVVQKLAACS
jgi:colanic acid biosynthesis glycosyl transferase WcaI